MFDNRLRNAGFNKFVQTVGRATCLEEIEGLGWRDIFLKLCAGCTGCGKPTAAGQSCLTESLLIRCWLAALGLQRRHKQEQQQQPHPQNNNNNNTNKNNNNNNNNYNEDDNNNTQMPIGKNLT
ncbi:unnamed protein product [Polarella glacialis]|uniref:Uncharacterized protein n=1 Tax=Polarella glacialis TaxID=89957 RepID=A0A813LJW5_POLGL|nr:unnamed protein product [Polarella glacialis]